MPQQPPPQHQQHHQPQQQRDNQPTQQNSPASLAYTKAYNSHFCTTVEWPDLSPIPHPDTQHELENHRRSDDNDGDDDYDLASLSTRSDVATSPLTCAPSRHSTNDRQEGTGSKGDMLEPKLPGKDPVPVGVYSTGPKSSAPNYDVATLLQQSWRKAIRVLRSNPQLMTRSVLCLALRQRPPVYAVDWMLRLNPAAANVPVHGPTPLFVAVQEKCSTAVVETLLRAAPMALVARASGGLYDPIALAKRERSQETDLLSLLHRPLSYWISESKRHRNTETSNEVDNEPHLLGIQKRKSLQDSATSIMVNDGATNSDILDQNHYTNYSKSDDNSKASLERNEELSWSVVSPETMNSPRHQIPSLLHRTRPLGTPEGSRSRSQGQTISPILTSARPTRSSPSSSSSLAWTAVERQELDNVKFLCLALLKAHRRFVETSSSTSNPTGTSNRREWKQWDESEREELMRLIDEKQKEHARILLIAMDMKEKSIVALARRLEERLTSCAHTESHVSQQNLRSSYVHLCRRLMGLEEELQLLRRAALSISSSSSSLSDDSSRAVFDSSEMASEQCPTEQEQHETTAPKRDGSVAGQRQEDETRSCLRLPWTRFRLRGSQH